VDRRELEFAAGAIRDADGTVVLTGVGVSTAPGIPRFPLGGRRPSAYDPESFHVSRFREDPTGF